MANEKNTERKPEDNARDSSHGGARATTQAMTGAAEATVGDMGRQVSDTMQTAAHMSEETVVRAQQTVEMALHTSATLAEGFQEIFREWASYTQGAVQRNVEGMRDLLQARTMTELLERQNNRMRDEMEMLLSSSIRTAELSAKAASNAARRLHEAAPTAQRAQQRRQG